MPSFSTRRIVPFTPRQMFDLVADVERYPQFLPLCEGLIVRKREVRPEGVCLLLADMTVGYKAIRETFTSRVALDPSTDEVNVSYVDGPFKYLENKWRFRPVAGGSEILFDISYEMKSRMFGLLVGAVFEKAFRKFAEAFEARARVVYGMPRPLPAESA
jgi:coenzyme Q-binding protein COQ10